jgi:hypothetical protein
MGKRIYSVLVTMVVTAPLFGQPAPLLVQPEAVPLPTPVPVLPPDAVILPGPPILVSAGPVRAWIDVEFLGWWVKSTPLPISLTANSVEQLNSDVPFDMLSGVRITGGAWFDADRNIGFEANFFSFDRQRTHAFIGTDGNGSPALAIPFNNVTPGNVGAFVLRVSNPGQTSGNVVTSSDINLWGAEINSAWCLARVPHLGLEWTLLAGFRYLYLQEHLNFSPLTNSDLTTNPTVTIFNDDFRTTNNFYGGQLGSRLVWEGQRFAIMATGKVALGGTQEILQIQGQTNVIGANGQIFAGPGGFFAQASNMGRFTSTQFAVVPSVELKFFWNLSRTVRLFAGYDFLYWNQVVRPGSQIDRNLNLSQSSVLGNGALIGPAAPTVLFNRTDFWAQGFNVGIELRF